MEPKGGLFWLGSWIIVLVLNTVGYMTLYTDGMYLAQQPQQQSHLEGEPT